MPTPLRLLALLLLLPHAALAADSPARYRTGRPEPQLAQVPPELQRNVFVDPVNTLKPLTDSLLRGVADPFLRVKILHDWIAENIAYDVDSFFSGAQIDTAWAETLRRRKSVCQGYAALMAQMCQLAGIRCELIAGYGRGYAFLNTPSEDPRQQNHAWNAVQVNGNWLLVDVTWDAGNVEGRTFHKRYGTGYLFLEPQQFFYTHLPAKPEWQLLDRPLSPEQFHDLPYLPGRFFEHGLRLTSALHRLTPARESIQFSLEIPSDVLLMARLLGTDGKEIPKRTLLLRDGQSTRMLVYFAKPGRSTVRLFAKHRTDAGMYDLVATLEFDATAGTPYVFPATYSAYDQLDARLESPRFDPLPADRPQTFRIFVGRPTEVHLVLGPQSWHKLRPKSGSPGVYELDAAVPRGAAAKFVAADPAKPGSFTTLVEYGPSK